ncbi:NAD(P)H-dependent oxidoreductase [Spirillospora sp. NBC_01491]|uniref:NAD(P)H-dependent oxidoreductase n=1 Tax=Spirillospora sp. NBC_01491 TaxID=2976007 RepID=UPI003FA7E73F
MAKSHARLYDSAPLRDRVAAADVLLLVTPELNRAVPGLVKDVVDWLGILREAAAALDLRIAVAVSAPPGRVC